MYTEERNATASSSYLSPWAYDTSSTVSLEGVPMRGDGGDDQPGHPHISPHSEKTMTGQPTG